MQKTGRQEIEVLFLENQPSSKNDSGGIKKPRGNIHDDAKAHFGNKEYKSVSMNQSDKIVWKEGDGSKAIYTFGLRGCTATAIHITRIDGSQEYCITHYDPLKKKSHIESIEKLLGEKSTIQNISSVIVSPGDCVQDQSGKWIMKTKDKDYTKTLEVTMKSMFHKSVIKEITYSQNYELGNSNKFISREGILEFSVNEQGKAKAMIGYDTIDL